MTRFRNLSQFKIILVVFCSFHTLQFEDNESIKVTCVLSMSAITKHKLRVRIRLALKAQISPCSI